MLVARAEQLIHNAERKLGAQLFVTTSIADAHDSPAFARILGRQATILGRDPSIEEAKRLISSQYGIPRADAFEVLKRMSQRRNQKLADVARGYVSNEALRRANRAG